MRRAGPLLVLLLVAPPAWAEARMGVRVGDHPTHGRVVFDAPSGTSYRVEAEEGRVRLSFGGGATPDLAAVRRPPRNVLAIEAAPGSAAILVPPGTRLRHMRLGDRIVVDLLDPEAPEASATARAAAPRTAERAASSAPGTSVSRPAPPPPPPF
ncbi:hypothetical protein, partial [Falsiroseomonas oryziterrae]